MINLIVAYDDNDLDLGDYFELSFNDISVNFSTNNGITVRPIRGLNCTEDYVLGEINSFTEEPFGFVGLSHGDESHLLTENNVYVDCNSLAHFKKTLFYSTACSTAIELGKLLIKNDCFSYVGFADDTFATYEEFYNDYIECENYCLKDFFNSENTIKQSFDSMLKRFDEKILELESKDEILVAMELIGNKDSFVLYGNTELTKSDLE
ncbi:hypothetical protein [Aquimarina macrocephali]|uniref:hypothetical protein n=1 Tax=Aquimarina macrocephali TaxID=666563 RepID=UPI000463B1F4|nr:hypothetical protein [Aquimarina macrocephali]